jgi:hypothetical protein
VPWVSYLLIALSLSLPACNCDSLLAVFSDVAYTSDGRALVLEANDGIYVARPPTDGPQRATDRHCTDSPTHSLDCVRVSSNGRKLAVLSAPRVESGSKVWDLELIGMGEASDGSNELEEPVSVAAGVLDAAFSQDARELLWAKPGSAADTVDVYRRASDGSEQELAREISLGGASSSAALEAIAISAWGIAYPRESEDAVEIWFKPFDGDSYDLGRLRSDCAGPQFSRCLLAGSDGATLVWQEKDSYVIHAFRAQRQVDLPLGQGYGFAFTRTGSYVLRMNSAPDSANVQNLDTAVVARGIVGALSGELSADGETVAFLKHDSTVLGTSRLFVGASRQDGRDRDCGLFEESEVWPLVAQSMGKPGIDHSMTGDGRFVIVSTKASEEGYANLLAVDTDTCARRTLGAFACNRCCMAAPAGSMLVCLRPPGAGQSSSPIDLYDPVSGTKTTAGEKVIDLKVLFDGSGVAVLDDRGSIPEGFLATKDGRVVSMGSALRFALSPQAGQIALLSGLGRLSVGPLP